MFVHFLFKPYSGRGGAFGAPPQYRILEVAIRMPLNKTKGSAFKLRWGVCGGTVSPLQLDLGEMFHFKQLGSLKDGF